LGLCAILFHGVVSAGAETPEMVRRTNQRLRHQPISTTSATAPKSTYRGTQLLQGPTRFVLAASGHIAGVVNPPDDGKYSHWVGSDLPASADEWFAGAIEMAGSWWPDWHRWITALAPDQVPARIPGASPLGAIEDAPGRYVLVKA